MAKLDFGITKSFNLDHVASAGEFANTFDDQVRQARLAEQLGFCHYYVVEHQGNDEGLCSSPTVFLSAVAQQTSTLRLGTMMLQLPFHNPIRIAQDEAMLDQLSRGRVDFGAGSGVLEHEFLRWNLPFGERREMAYEALEIIEKAWAEEVVSYEGKYWKFNEALPWPKPYQKPHPPIWFGAISPATFEYAARHNYNLAQWGDVDEVAVEKVNHWRSVWKECGHEGPIPRSSLTRTVYVAETDEQALEEAAPHIVNAIKQGHEVEGGVRVERTQIGWRGNPGTGAYRDLNLVFEGMASGIDFWCEHGLAHVGSPETVIRRLEEQHQLIGFNVFSAYFRFGNLSNELVERSIRLFGEKVIPSFS